ncbi:pyrroline-5-carboxylate reductase [Apilactobacillus quenuiae]|uniref:pyrroline-5-carboxylate reductase n=1 Tax=Apilactobacillus quenuiae TaxID=2008377 RepID=UPI000D01FFDE|nr:pyrroline-5-carboxylate reductase [Apilactobacillus quenuiae]
MKIGFIGVGSMARAMIKGFINSRNINSNDILIHSKHSNNYVNFAKKHELTAVSTNEELVKNSDYIILAVNPNQVVDVLKDTRKLLSVDNKILVSIVWDYSLNRLEELTDYDLPIFRTVPNVNVEINTGSLVYTYNENFSDESLNDIISKFNLLGDMINLPENKLNTAGALVGCTPAYAYLFADAFSRVAVKHGLSKNESNNMIAQAIKGSMNMIIKSNDNPADLMDEVCSPGGSTIKGLLALKENGFENAIDKCFDATQDN